jgi:RNA polymerase sigma-70 factor (sigma-E family)
MEIGRAAYGWASAHGPGLPIVAFTEVPNRASRAVMERLGMRHSGIIRRAGLSGVATGSTRTSRSLCAGQPEWPLVSFTGYEASVVNRVDEDEYRQFVTARLEPLRVTAYLLCRDWHTADDLVSITVGKLYRHWPRVRAVGNVDAYVRGMLTNAWLDEQRRPWRRERVTDDVPDQADLNPPQSALADREVLLDLLTRLPARRRAVVVLRFYCDLSVEETARALGISTGTVKSQAARGLESLRAEALGNVARNGERA